MDGDYPAKLVLPGFIVIVLILVGFQLDASDLTVSEGFVALVLIALAAYAQKNLFPEP